MQTGTGSGVTETYSGRQGYDQRRQGQLQADTDLIRGDQDKIRQTGAGSDETGT